MLCQRIWGAGSRLIRDDLHRGRHALGGSVDIDSAEGYGMRVSVRLPLTLAIMDGMSVGVGEEVYILPLMTVVESFQVQPGNIKTIGGNAPLVARLTPMRSSTLCTTMSSLARG